MITPVAFYQEPTTTIKKLNRILVSTNTTTAGTIALYKYDSDGNVITSRTYTEVGGSSAWRPRIIYSELDDDNFYYSNGPTTGRLIKWNASDLTISASASLAASTDPRIMPLGSTKDFIILSELASISFRLKSNLTSTGSSISWSTGKAKNIIRVSDVSASTSDVVFFVFQSATVDMRRYSFATASYGTSLYSGKTTIYDVEAGVLIKEDNTFLLASQDAIFNISDGSENIDPVDAGAPIEFGLHRFSNGDILIIESLAFRRRTLANVKAGSATNVWSVSLSTIVAGTIDDEDNVYIVLSGTTNAFRKYNSSGTLVWQRTLAATGFGIGIAHK